MDSEDRRSKIEGRNSKIEGRCGFTLVEMLVVLGIIGIIVSLSAAAAFQVIAYQRVANTETLIRNLDKALQQQWKIATDQANSETLPSALVSYAGDQRRARVIWIKLRLKQEFPMNFSEALSPIGIQGVGVLLQSTPQQSPYYTLLQQAQITTATAQSPPQNAEPGPGQLDESSAMLFLALQHGRSGAVFNVDNLPSGAVQSGVYALKGGGTTSLQQFTDSWGMPLAFYRWPALNAELDGMCPASSSSPTSVFRDPADPDGLLLNPTWWSSNVTTFESALHLLHNPSVNPASPRAYFMLPTIASRGKDVTLGLTRPGSSSVPDPMQADGTGNDNDNIYSYRLREQARGD